MLIEVDEYDLSVLLKGLGYEDECDLLAEYLVDCCCDTWNVKSWINNTYNHTILCFETEEETLKYIEKEGLTHGEDCFIYKGHYGYILDID